MAANAVLSGFPPIWRMKFFQASGATPGRLIARTMVLGPDLLSELPRFGTLTLNARNFTGIWPNMRVFKAPRVRNGYTNLILEDDRWLLQYATMQQNFNERDSEGNIMSGQKKTIEELVEELATSSGLELKSGTVGAGTLPDFEPPARWAGRKAADCLQQLLRDTGCRCVYNPVTQEYTVSQCGTGADIPNANERIYREGPQSRVKEIIFKSAPVLYEDELDVTAKRINTSTGDTEALDEPITLPTDPTEDYGQTRLRLWEPDGVTHPEEYEAEDCLFLDRRAKAHLFNPERPIYEHARIVRDEYDRFPVHQPLGAIDSNVARAIDLTGGGRAFLTDHPVLLTDDTGLLLDTCKLICAYYIKDPTDVEDGLIRNSETVTIDATAPDTITRSIPWIIPVDSTLPDLDSDEWDNLLPTVAAALATRYNPVAAGNKPETIRLSNPRDLEGSGKIGAVEYEFTTIQNRGRIYFSVALNFDPARMGDIR